MVLVLWPVGVEMMAPAGIDGAEDVVNTPAVESCNAEVVIASDRGGGSTRGARAAAEARGAGGNPRLGRLALIPSQKELFAVVSPNRLASLYIEGSTCTTRSYISIQYRNIHVHAYKENTILTERAL